MLRLISIIFPFSHTDVNKRDEGTGEWRKLHEVELNDMYSSSNIVRGIKSRRIAWVGNIACMGKEEKYTGF